LNLPGFFGNVAEPRDDFFRCVLTALVVNKCLSFAHALADFKSNILHWLAPSNEDRSSSVEQLALVLRNYLAAVLIALNETDSTIC